MKKLKHRNFPVVKPVFISKLSNSATMFYLFLIIVVAGIYIIPSIIIINLFFYQVWLSPAKNQRILASLKLLYKKCFYSQILFRLTKIKASNVPEASSFQYLGWLGINHPKEVHTRYMQNLVKCWDLGLQPFLTPPESNLSLSLQWGLAEALFVLYHYLHFQPLLLVLTLGLLKLLFSVTGPFLLSLTSKIIHSFNNSFNKNELNACHVAEILLNNGYTREDKKGPFPHQAYILVNI